MTAPTLVYLTAPKKAVEALLALGAATVMLATDSYVPDQDAHDFVNDVTNEAAGTGYSAGGIVLTGVTVTLDTATNTLALDADDVTPAGLSVVCRWAVIYVDTGTPATSPTIAFVDLSEGLGGNVTVTGILWDADGIVPFVVAA